NEVRGVIGGGILHPLTEHASAQRQRPDHADAQERPARGRRLGQETSLDAASRLGARLLLVCFAFDLSLLSHVLLSHSSSAIRARPGCSALCARPCVLGPVRAAHGANTVGCTQWRAEPSRL